MSDDGNCWLLLEKSDDTRISKGIDGYLDMSGEVYVYDSLVPNHKNVKNGDLAIIRKEQEILGFGRIGSISENNSVKAHRRCPSCNKTDIRERKTKSPKWKCGKCAQEFSEPRTTTTKVRVYNAKIVEFIRLDNPPSVKTVKDCATRSSGIHSQLSILRLDANKLRAVFEDLVLPPSGKRAVDTTGQGFGLSYEERKAVELHAMQLAATLYQKQGWKVVDRSNSCPYDLLVWRDGQERFIEVKGTTGNGKSIVLTHGEVRHASEHSEKSALVVVGNVRLTQNCDDWIASEGVIIYHQDPWIINETLLRPTQFRYEVQ